MIKWENVEEGMTLFQVTYDRSGIGKPIRTCWPVRIITIDRTADTCVVSWNTNKPSTMWRREVETLQQRPPRPRK